MPPAPTPISNCVSPTATTTTRSRGPSDSEPTTRSALALPAPRKPGRRLAIQPRARIRPTTITSATTAPPMLPAVAGDCGGSAGLTAVATVPGRWATAGAAVFETANEAVPGAAVASALVAPASVAA